MTFPRDPPFTNTCIFVTWYALQPLPYKNQTSLIIHYQGRLYCVSLWYSTTNSPILISITDLQCLFLWRSDSNSCLHRQCKVIRFLDVGSICYRLGTSLPPDQSGTIFGLFFVRLGYCVGWIFASISQFYYRKKLSILYHMINLKERSLSFSSQGIYPKRLHFLRI